jgi:hypothetical protein
LNTHSNFIFASRWLLAPFYVGLVGAIALLLFKFVKEFINLLPVVVNGEAGHGRRAHPGGCGAGGQPARHHHLRWLLAFVLSGVLFA